MAEACSALHLGILFGLKFQNKHQRDPVVAWQVGSQFVAQYYSVLHKSPHYLHRFYTDQSTMTYSTGNKDAQQFNSQQVGGTSNSVCKLACPAPEADRG